MQKKDKDEAIKEAIKTLLASADSHLDHIYDSPSAKAQKEWAIGNGTFHRKCIKDYLKSAYELSNLL